MSERGQFRGGRGGGGGRGTGTGSAEGRGGRGGTGGAGGRGGGGGAHGGASQEKPKRENILDLTKYMDKEITVKFNGGREGECPSEPVASRAGSWRWTDPGFSGLAVVGVLKGYDQLMNLVLDDVRELLRGTHSSLPPGLEAKRHLLIVVRW